MIAKGVRVVVSATRKFVEGDCPALRHDKNRKPVGTKGVLTNPVPHTNELIWYVKHDDEVIAVYHRDELKQVPVACKPMASAKKRPRFVAAEA